MLCAPIVSQLELFDLIFDNLEYLQGWNTEMYEFFAQERKPAVFEVVL